MKALIISLLLVPSFAFAQLQTEDYKNNTTGSQDLRKAKRQMQSTNKKISAQDQAAMKKLLLELQDTKKKLQERNEYLEKMMDENPY